MLAMTRVLKALGVAACGFFACLFVLRILILFRNPSTDQLFGYLFLAILAAPIVALILFLVYFYSTENAVQPESKPAKSSFDAIRLSLSTLVAIVSAIFFFHRFSDHVVRNDRSGAWLIPFGANIEAFFLAPLVAIVIFLLAYYVMGLFRPMFGDSVVDS